MEFPKNLFLPTDALEELDEKATTAKDIMAEMTTEQILASLALLLEKVAGPNLKYVFLLNRDGKVGIASNYNGKAKLSKALEIAVEKVGEMAEAAMFKNVFDSLASGGKLSEPTQWINEFRKAAES